MPRFIIMLRICICCLYIYCNYYIQNILYLHILVLKMKYVISLPLAGQKENWRNYVCLQTRFKFHLSFVRNTDQNWLSHQGKKKQADCISIWCRHFCFNRLQFAKTIYNHFQSEASTALNAQERLEAIRTPSPFQTASQ